MPGGVWALGFVSLFMDISSELIHSLLPVFMTTVLGAPMITIGLIEGFAEATAAITRVFSGAISDYFGKRKLIAGLGYGLAALTKPIFPLANTIGWVFAARFIDRIGKGLRGAPRDALVADIAPPEQRGAAFGLRQSLDSVGAFVGPMVGLALMAWLANDIRAVLWVAVGPAFIAVALLVFCVREPRHAGSVSGIRSPPKLTDARRLPRRFWLIVLLGAVFSLARFSEAFLILRAQDVGMPIGYVPLVLVVMNVAYTATAYPAGVAADRMSQRTLLIVGLAALIAADLVLAVAASPTLALIGAAVWGVHMGLTQGLFAKLVADTGPLELRGTAFGIFHLVSGGALLLASALAGGLWGAFGAPVTFLVGAGFATLAVLGLLLSRAEPTRSPPIKATGTPTISRSRLENIQEYCCVGGQILSARSMRTTPFSHRRRSSLMVRWPCAVRIGDRIFSRHLHHPRVVRVREGLRCFLQVGDQRIEGLHAHILPR